MRRWGASDEELAQAEALALAAQGEEEIEIWPENWDHWVFFTQRVANRWQWVSAGLAGIRRMALDLPSVQLVARTLGYRGTAWQALLEDLLTIERAVLETDAELRQQNG